MELSLGLSDSYCDVKDSYECSEFFIRSAKFEEREVVKDFVCRVHLTVSAYSPESLSHQIEDLPTDFPELFDDSQWKQSKCFLCFSSDGTLLGCIGLRQHSESSLEIGYFFLEEFARGKGIGRKLLKLAISWSREISEKLSRMITSIVLLTLRVQMDIAIALYESEGFVTYEEKKVEFYTLVLMRLLLFQN